MISHSSYHKPDNPINDNIKFISDEIRSRIVRNKSHISENNYTNIISDLWNIVIDYYTEDVRCLDVLMNHANWILDWDGLIRFENIHFHRSGSTHMRVCAYRASGCVGNITFTEKTHWSLEDREALEVLLILPRLNHDGSELEHDYSDLTHFNRVRIKMYNMLNKYL